QSGGEVGVSGEGVCDVVGAPPAEEGANGLASQLSGDAVAGAGPRKEVNLGRDLWDAGAASEKTLASFIKISRDGSFHGMAFELDAETLVPKDVDLGSAAQKSVDVVTKAGEAMEIEQLTGSEGEAASEPVCKEGHDVLLSRGWGWSAGGARAKKRPVAEAGMLGAYSGLASRSGEESKAGEAMEIEQLTGSGGKSTSGFISRWMGMFYSGLASLSGKKNKAGEAMEIEQLTGGGGKSASEPVCKEGRDVLLSRGWGWSVGGARAKKRPVAETGMLGAYSGLASRSGEESKSRLGLGKKGSDPGRGIGLGLDLENVGAGFEGILTSFVVSMQRGDSWGIAFKLDKVPGDLVEMAISRVTEDQVIEGLRRARGEGGVLLAARRAANQPSNTEAACRAWRHRDKELSPHSKRVLDDAALKVGRQSSWDLKVAFAFTVAALVAMIPGLLCHYLKAKAVKAVFTPAMAMWVVAPPVIAIFMLLALVWIGGPSRSTLQDQTVGGGTPSTSFGGSPQEVAEGEGLLPSPNVSHADVKSVSLGTAAMGAA
ncbi:MAG: hypothetical protein ACTJLK_00885, partial [Anaplasma sp.]